MVYRKKTLVEKFDKLFDNREPLLWLLAFPAGVTALLLCVPSAVEYPIYKHQRNKKKKEADEKTQFSKSRNGLYYFDAWSGQICTNEEVAQKRGLRS